MNQNYDSVPNVISCKDLDYLNDMFNWNYEAYKKNYNFLAILNDSELKEISEKASNIFYGTMQSILNIFEEGGQDE